MSTWYLSQRTQNLNVNFQNQRNSSFAKPSWRSKPIGLTLNLQCKDFTFILFLIPPLFSFFPTRMNTTARLFPSDLVSVYGSLQKQEFF